MSYREKSLDAFTVDDWLEARRSLTAPVFGQLKSVARASGLAVPTVVAGRNVKPEIVFEFQPSAMALESRVQDSEALRKFQKAVYRWCDDVTMHLKISAPKSDPYTLRDSIDYYVRNDPMFHAEPYRIGFRFARHGVHLHFGASRGYGGDIGSRWIDRLGNVKQTDPQSLGKAGTGQRKPYDWFNPVLERSLPALADIAASYCADMIINSDYLYLG